MDPIPADAFLAGYPDGILEAAQALRGIVRRAVPGAVERVRSGWRLIGYDLPVGRRSVYFAFVTFRPGDAISEPALVELTREAARVAALSHEARLGLVLDRD